MAKQYLYKWRSNALANYAPGTIIVMASDVVTARELAIAEWHEQCTEIHCLVDDDKKQEKLEQFKEDLNGDHEVVESNVILVTGSE